MPSRSLSLAEQIAQLSNPAPQEFDPESVQDLYASDRDEVSEVESEVDGDAGREHYIEVGKSKLRRNQDLHLHPKYNGAAVSRDNLYEDGDGEDNEGEDENEGESDSEDDEDSDDGDARLSASLVLNRARANGERKKTLKVASGESDEELGSMEDMRSDNDIDHMDDEDDDDDDDLEDDDDDDGEDIDEESEEAEKSRRAELRNLMAQEQKNVVASLSQAAEADAQKGLAVRNQRAFFDECLKSRMQIKNALISANSLPSSGLDSSDETVKAAEDAAIVLWNTISQLRYDLAKSREPSGPSKKSSTKRKHEDITKDTSLEEVWKLMKKAEVESTIYRSSTLEKWSSKVQATSNVVLTAKKFNQSTASVQTVSSQLREYLTNVSSETAKSIVPQESAPVQKEQKLDEDPNIYDDTDFYKRLLLVLLEQRGNNATNRGVVQLAPADLQELKAKKKRSNVDTKASKGRKLRYHVHEKLQNFMMPDDELIWHEQQIDEFFSSLLGQRRRMLDEQLSDLEKERDEMAPVAQLFRNTTVS